MISSQNVLKLRFSVTLQWPRVALLKGAFHQYRNVGPTPMNCVDYVNVGQIASELYSRPRRGERQRKPLEVVAFELLMRASPHIDLLTDHRKFVMKGFRVPVLLGEGGIDEAFSNLFSVKGKPGKRCTPPLSECIANLATPLKYGYILDKGIKTWLSFHSVKTIDDVLCLY